LAEYLGVTIASRNACPDEPVLRYCFPSVCPLKVENLPETAHLIPFDFEQMNGGRMVSLAKAVEVDGAMRGYDKNPHSSKRD